MNESTSWGLGFGLIIGLLVGAATMAVLIDKPAEERHVIHFGDKEAYVSGPGRDKCLDTLIPTMLDNMNPVQ